MLLEGEKIVKMWVTVYTQYRHVPDGRTDRQTDGHLATAQSALYIRVAR